jgi:hypothetical protein
MKPIEVFVRINPGTNNRERPSWFSKEVCYNNLIKTTDFNIANITYYFDGDPVENKDFFLLKKTDNIQIHFLKNGKSDAASFFNLVQHVSAKNYSHNPVIYFLEDDYLHRKNWTEILLEGFLLDSNGYCTLYDHPDKYWKFVYPDLKSELFLTKSCYWRTTPSTTHTFAVKYDTFKEDVDLMLKYCDLKTGSNWDHNRFKELTNRGRKIYSSIPGWSTHCGTNYLAPFINWEKIL